MHAADAHGLLLMALCVCESVGFLAPCQGGFHFSLFMCATHNASFELKVGIKRRQEFKAENWTRARGSAHGVEKKRSVFLQLLVLWREANTSTIHFCVACLLLCSDKMTTQRIF
jgi:hypothetical protein